jgi:hypothetical protein
MMSMTGVGAERIFEVKSPNFVYLEDFVKY